eukprot:SAG31_NODE_16441_length_709_cov_1.118033_1_plen_28_part_10
MQDQLGVTWIAWPLVGAIFASGALLLTV